MERRQFSARLEGRGPNSAWVFVPIPFDVEAAFGSRGRVAVAGTLNGFEFRTSILPEGDGTHAMPVNKAMRAGARAEAGEVVEVVLERDVAERTVPVPPELEAALAEAPAARERFAALAPSHRKEYAQWVGSAKKAETREARALKAVEMLRAGRRMR
jgi:hypothetical protein